MHYERDVGIYIFKLITFKRTNYLFRNFIYFKYSSKGDLIEFHFKKMYFLNGIHNSSSYFLKKIFECILHNTAYGLFDTSNIIFLQIHVA